MGQDLALEVGLDVLLQRHIFGVAQAAVGLGIALLVRDKLPLGITLWAFDCDGGIAEVLGVERFSPRGPSSKAPVQAGHLLDLLRAHFLALGSQDFFIFCHRRWHSRAEPCPCVPALVVGQHPHVGRNARVVEHVRGQGDNGFQKVIL